MVSERIKNIFNEREEMALNAIVQSGIDFIEVGIYGSYARGTYKGTSDIDIACIVEDIPDGDRECYLTVTLEMRDVDLKFFKQTDFLENKSEFYRQLRRDYIRRI